MPDNVLPPAKNAPFPLLEGGCNCNQIRYRLRGPPMYCYACHCADCQRESGSVFACSAKIEFDMIESIGPQAPAIVSIVRKEHNGHAIHRLAQCPECKVTVWDTGNWNPSTYNVHVGTLDMPGLMEPDIHIYVDAKVRWVVLPEGAKTVPRDMDERVHWPKSSLLRLKRGMERWEKKKALTEAEAEKKKAEQSVNAEKGKEVEKDADPSLDDEADKTPTNGSPEPELEGEEDDEEEDFEEYVKKADEMERALQQRLEQLTLKLSEQNKA
ncbi:hypothetical protein K491DRAFT_282161 [Lophiostoma macrostomum CBS 122681]|uniref:CENP-V/GFA domain-containing protein n=1 Tax=Lophiostoma macrostomum CBS 122681 TaxID=1314788 RepID=A0A6A6TQ15_9PLEO|nr:hypothetical protein K491DRAFT_282161 [Lophiostoma macrostomum CBS 122681]